MSSKDGSQQSKATKRKLYSNDYADDEGSDDNRNGKTSTGNYNAKKFKAFVQKNDGKIRQKLHRSSDDEKEDCCIAQSNNEIFPERYEVCRQIGKGAYGRVFKAYDREEHCHVAIKLITYSRTNVWTAQYEVKLLEMLNKADINNQCHIVRLKRTFSWRRYMCLVFELLSYDLLKILYHRNPRGISLEMTRKFSQQLCTALNFLSKLNIIHGDIKPQNIILCDPKKSAIKIVDFGAAYEVGQRIRLVHTINYISPEALLGLPRSPAIDMWSLGCTLVELLTGETLFMGDNKADQMNRIVELLGMPPKDMLDKGPGTRKYFRKMSNGEYVLRKLTRAVNYKAPGTRDLHDILGVKNGQHLISDCLMFKDLIYRMLDYDPKTRITPSNALKHNFFKKTLAEETNSSCPSDLNLVTDISTNSSGLSDLNLETQVAINDSRTTVSMSDSGPETLLTTLELSLSSQLCEHLCYI